MKFVSQWLKHLAIIIGWDYCWDIDKIIDIDPSGLLSVVEIEEYTRCRIPFFSLLISNQVTQNLCNCILLKGSFSRGSISDIHG